MLKRFICLILIAALPALQTGCITVNPKRLSITSDANIGIKPPLAAGVTEALRQKFEAAAQGKTPLVIKTKGGATYEVAAYTVENGTLTGHLSDPKQTYIALPLSHIAKVNGQKIQGGLGDTETKLLLAVIGIPVTIVVLKYLAESLVGAAGTGWAQ